MKALVSAFALLTFVAATTVPYVAHAQTQTLQSTPNKAKGKKKSVKKTSHKKVSHKKVSHKKQMKKAAPKPVA